MNIYDNPEKFGCYIVGEVDAGGGYEHDKFVVWKNDQNKKGFGWGTSSGCSCNSPFYDDGITDLEWSRAQTCHKALDVWAKAKLEFYAERIEAEVADLHNKIAKA